MVSFILTNNLNLPGSTKEIIYEYLNRFLFEDFKERPFCKTYNRQGQRFNSTFMIQYCLNRNLSVEIRRNIIQLYINECRNINYPFDEVMIRDNNNMPVIRINIGLTLL